MSDVQTAFRPILNFARFQCLLPIKTVCANGKCKKSSLAARIFAAVLFASTSYMAYLIFNDLFFNKTIPLFTNAVFTCIYLSNVLIVFCVCCTSHNFIRNGCKWLSHVLGTFAHCKLKATRKTIFFKNNLNMQRIKACYGACYAIGLIYLLICGKGNKLSWQFQAIKCIYLLQIYTIEQIISTLNVYFHQSFIELKLNIFRQSKTKVGTALYYFIRYL